MAPERCSAQLHRGHTVAHDVDPIAPAQIGRIVRAPRDVIEAAKSKRERAKAARQRQGFSLRRGQFEGRDLSHRGCALAIILQILVLTIAKLIPMRG